MTHTATFNPSWPTHMVIINAHNHPVIGNWNVIFVYCIEYHTCIYSQLRLTALHVKICNGVLRILETIERTKL